MDSRQLYNAAAHLDQVVSWDKQWIHFGTGDEVKYNLIQELLDDFLADEHLQLIHQRTNSQTIKRIEIMKELEGLLGREKFEIWNSNMDKVIKFDRIGVLLLGKK